VFRAVLEAGFDRVGCLPLSEAGDPRFEEWLASGMHGEMSYLPRHAPAKTNPERAFPQFRTVVVAAMEYGAGTPAPTDPLVGNISRYALGDDYHDVLKQRMRLAVQSLRALDPELRTRIFVDTGPINEKLVARKAGLGWVGRNTNLINPSVGSYLFLALLLVDAELEATGPEEPDRCGLCEDCIPACPTGAIVAPYVLDARRCISYLTIELRGAVPRDLRGLVGNRIFGCDDCQEVCPWNRFARAAAPEQLTQRPGFRDRTLEEWLALDEDSWTATFAGSPITRPGYVGFLRNVVVAAGCARDQSLKSPLRRFLRHQEALLRGHAAWALGELHDVEALESALTDEEEPWVKEEIQAALGRGF